MKTQTPLARAARPPTLRLTAMLSDPSVIDDLRQWLQSRVVDAKLDALSSMDDRPALGAQLELCHVLVLQWRARADAAVIAELLGHRASAPELILMDAPHPIAEELQNAGVAVAFQLNGPCAVERLGQAVLDTLAIHRLLRETCQRAVGKLPLRDALALVRLYMLRAAYGKTSSKRAAARELGLTRPAVQQMLRLRMP